MLKIAFSAEENITAKPWDYKIFGGLEVKKGAKVGKSNGLSMLLDAESYDYMFQVKHSVLNTCFLDYLLAGEGQ